MAAAPALDPTLLVQGQSLPVVLAVIGGLLLATLAIRRSSLQLGVPAVLGVLMFGLMLPDRLGLLQETTITNLHTAGLSMLLFFAGLQTEVRTIRGFLEYGVVLAAMLTAPVSAPPTPGPPSASCSRCATGCRSSCATCWSLSRRSMIRPRSCFSAWCWGWPARAEAARIRCCSVRPGCSSRTSAPGC